MADPSQRKVRFEEYELDLGTGDLWRRGRRVKLPEKPFQALAILVERAGQLVTREDLRERLWLADTFVAFEDNLNATVKRLRQALGDSAEQPHFIETVPRRGYRFIVPIEIALVEQTSKSESVNSPMSAELVPTSSNDRSRSPRPSLVVTLAAVGLMLIVAAGAFLALKRRPVAVNSPARYRLAISSFINLTGDSHQNYLASGLTDEARSRLRRISPQELTVIAYPPASAARAFIAEMAALRVDYVLDGSLQRQGGNVVLFTRLIHVHSQTQVWNAAFRLPLQETYVERDLARRVAQTLSLRALQLDAHELSDAYAANINSHEACLRGMYGVRRTSDSETRSAIDWFKSSINDDPQYAAAYAGLAEAYLSLSRSHALPREKAETQARAAIEAGMQLDASIADFYLLKAALFSSDPAKHGEVEKDYQHAIELDPEDPDAHTQYALFLRERRGSEALSEIQMARDLDPKSPWVNAYLGWILVSTGRLEDAQAQLDAALRLDPQLPATMRFMGNLEERRGDADRAAAWFEKAATASGRKPFYVYRLGIAYAKAGRERDLRALLTELRSRARTEYVDPQYIRVLQSGLGS